jgi:hypothetical protein
MSGYRGIITDSPRSARCWARRRPAGRLRPHPCADAASIYAT